MEFKSDEQISKQSKQERNAVSPNHDKGKQKNKSEKKNPGITIINIIDAQRVCDLSRSLLPHPSNPPKVDSTLAAAAGN